MICKKTKKKKHISCTSKDLKKAKNNISKLFKIS